ncbi:hypothetical protein STSP2_02295 [Anaerohalosphaera lusitana]|uniref:LamG-like jellyroll fold domain-containing protein n=1 Tax=Anaerohalosphaera lusitana TaxID=1936003 RepID=A0A1U9NN03_9BACT|nr:LamG-like jellyroll fold domain-containing protein [Anaerohalosphaera lusitana]AQT69108.1 hypothetical protein STSP2_02295 [Anaerohalosphaera lusitana]
MKRFMLLLAIVCLAGTTVMANTVAYWRFEDGAAGEQVLHGAGSGAFAADILDVSGNGNDLSVWDDTAFGYRDSVAYATVAQTGAANALCLKNTNGVPGMFTETGSQISTMAPAQFTIEATFKLENGGFRCIIGRDSQGTADENGDLAALYFQALPDNALAIKFCDQDGYWHQAVSATGIFQSYDFASNPNGDGIPWYSMTAVSDGQTLSLYLLEHGTDYDYRLIAQTDLTESGSTNTALTAGAGDGGDWDAGNWTVARGLYGGGHGDRAWGYMDEIRISDSALNPTEFLARPAGFTNAVSPARDVFLSTTTSATYSWTVDIPQDSQFDRYEVYVADNYADLAQDTPTTYLHKSAAITDVATTTYTWSGPYDYNNDYFYRIDAVTYDPNYADGTAVYDSTTVHPGTINRFFGPRACPDVGISGDVTNVPDATDHSYTPQDAVFIAPITRGTVGVKEITWYKVVGEQDNFETPDPNDPADIMIANVPGDTEVTYSPDVTNATETTLTIVAADRADNGDYYAYVKLLDPMGNGDGCYDLSPTANVFAHGGASASTDYLVHRYGFDGDATDSISGAHGTVVDNGDVNYSFTDGKIVLNNSGLTSGPVETVTDPADPEATRDMLLPVQGAYVDLPNGIVSALGKSATVMVWFTYDAADTGNWPRVFDMGTSTGGEDFATGLDGVEEINGEYYLADAPDSQEYIMMSPKVDAGPAWRFETVLNGGSTSRVTQNPDNSGVAGGQQACVACTFDGAAGIQKLYYNGMEVAEDSDFFVTLADIMDVNNWIGRSQFNDAMFSGSIDEFRIYNLALTGPWVEAYYELGPDAYNVTPNPCVEELGQMDFNDDCNVDMADFAEFAAEWLHCGRLDTVDCQL